MTTKNKISVLDHGFVQLRNIAGPTRRIWTKIPPCDAYPLEQYTLREFDADDTDVANSARISFEGMDKDRSYEVEMKLTEYLMKNRHMTPFETIEVWLEMKMPIFVARQFVRHRTASINECSARYIQLPSEWYIPELKDIVIQSKDKKQGGRLIDLDDPTEVLAAELFRQRLQDNCQRSYESYQWAIDDGIAMEQARLELHVNHYTHWLWKQDLRNLFGFLVLRDHGHAQSESRRYATSIIQLLEPQIPGLIKIYKELLSSN